MVRKSNNGFFGRKGNKVKFVAALCLAAGLLLPACIKPAENEVPPQPESWTASFGGQVEDGGQAVDGGQLADGGQATQPGNTAKMTPKPTKVPQPTKTIEEKMEEILAGMAYPTVVPPREFTPKEGQTEFVLWMSLEGRWRVDDHIVAELNHILQEREYPFYLTVKMEPEPESVRDELSPWQEIFDAGEGMDLVFFFDSDDSLSGKLYGKTSMERMLAGGYLLPFSKYPDTPAKERLHSAYGEEYWRMCSFGGENYGVSNWMLNYPVGKECLLLNLDAAGEAGIEIPEELDLLHLDGLLEKASAAGVPGIGVYTSEILSYCGILRRSDSLFVKCLPDGGYSFVNPFADEELQRTMEAVNRYWENGWVDKGLEEKLPLLLLETSCGALSYLEGDRFVRWTNDGNEQSARVKVYREENYVVQEGRLRDILGIASGSRHKEEALELLCLMHTDEEIVRLLRYGLEGIHYRQGEDVLEEVKTAWAEARSLPNGNYAISHGIKTWGYPGNFTLGNPRLPLELDELAGIRHREDAGFYGDIGGVVLLPCPEALPEGAEETMKKIRDILYVERGGALNEYSFGDLWERKKESCEQELERMQAAFAEAGYDELIGELNEKLRNKN